jgi:hypothetical protein
MRDAGSTAALAFRDLHRRNIVPGCQTRSSGATSRQSPISGPSPMTKKRVEIDGKNPFIPSLSPVCCMADLVLVFSVALVGLVAVGATLIAHL